MKKTAVLIVILVLLSAVGRAAAEDKKKEEISPDFHFVEKVEPVPDNMKVGFDSITSEEVEAYMRFLASDLLEGRDTDSKMYRVAAHFAAALFRLWQVKPAGDLRIPRRLNIYSTEQKEEEKPERSYFQAVRMQEILESESSIIMDYRSGSLSKTKTFLGKSDYNYYYRSIENVTAPLVFVGYGISEKSIDFDEYKGIDVKGKILLMLDKVPQQDQKDSPFSKGELKSKYRYRGYWRVGNPKVSLAKEKGAAAILLVRERSQSYALPKEYDKRPIIPWKDRRLLLINPSLPTGLMDPFPLLVISPEMADTILGFSGLSLESLQNKIDSGLKRQSRPLTGITIAIKHKVKTQSINCINVLGIIEGSDPELKKEVVMIGAHLDHLGKMGEYIFNGADDNASGSAAVLAMARAFALNPVKPKRSIMFALWTGEEKGLLGSRYYVDHPFVPLKKMAAHINLDMVGRSWESKKYLEDRLKRYRIKVPRDIVEKKLDTKNFIMPSTAESSPWLYDIVRESNRYVGFYLYIRKSTGSRGSDHAAFARKNVPWMRYLGGLHDDGHEPWDNVERIDFDFLHSITRLTYLTAFHLADR